MWHHAAENAEVIGRLYTDPGGLDQVTIQEAQLDLQRWLLRLRLELPRFPDRAPPRWERGANAVQVTLDCWLVDTPGRVAIQLGGIAASYPARLELRRDGAALDLRLTGDTASVLAACSMVRIDRVTPYRREADGGG